MKKDWSELITRMRGGSVRALSRLVSRVENREPGWMEAMKQIFPLAGKARLVGITGSPGAGKSTLTNGLARELVKRGHKVGIIAVDPSSPFSGGSLLGDRVRMKDLWNLEEVFIRSMATRGALGGLNQSARDVAKILDAAGKDFVLIETVGVGQDEVEVVRTADLVLVVCVPGQGDGVQALKAGIMEIADIFVVNKADREGADAVVLDIQTMLDLDSGNERPKPPILKTEAPQGRGLPELTDHILVLLTDSRPKRAWQEMRIREELLRLLETQLGILVRDQWEKDGGLDRAVRQIQNGDRDPYSIVQERMNSFFKQMEIKSGT
ncbi:MAG: methylmalonyl Co-A mutase-associated GTPase MeaB [Thermodesulfobacteriota bacterium]